MTRLDGALDVLREFFIRNGRGTVERTGETHKSDRVGLVRHEAFASRSRQGLPEPRLNLNLTLTLLILVAIVGAAVALLSGNG